MSYLPSSILDTVPLKSPWTYLVSTKLPDDLLQELLIFYNNIAWQYVEKDENTHIQDLQVGKRNLKFTELPLASTFLAELNSPVFHKQILDYYNLPHNDWEHSITVDFCNEDSYNGSHNDMHDSKEVITLQYYLNIDDPSRHLKINDKLLSVGTGHGIMFKSFLRSWHSFDAGPGTRCSIRLRLRQKLVDPSILHNPIDNDLSVIIDCKDMESGLPYGNLEKKLGRLTYESCKQHGVGNVVLFESRNDFATALATCPTDKILILFAGALISNNTVQWATTADGQYGRIMNNNKLGRQFFLFSQSKLKGELNIKGNYLQEQVQYTTNADSDTTDIYYEHPDSDTYESIDALIGYEPHLLEDNAYRLEDLFNNSSN